MYLYVYQLELFKVVRIFSDEGIPHFKDIYKLGIIYTHLFWDFLGAKHKSIDS